MKSSEMVEIIRDRIRENIDVIGDDVMDMLNQVTNDIRLLEQLHKELRFSLFDDCIEITTFLDTNKLKEFSDWSERVAHEKDKR